MECQMGGGGGGTLRLGLVHKKWMDLHCEIHLV